MPKLKKKVFPAAQDSARTATSLVCRCVRHWMICCPSSPARFAACCTFVLLSRRHTCLRPFCLPVLCLTLGLHPELYYIPSNFSLSPPPPPPPPSPAPPYVCERVVCERFAKWYSYAIGCAWRIRNPCLVSHESFWYVCIYVCVFVCVCVYVCIACHYISLCVCVCVYLCTTHARISARSLAHTSTYSWYTCRHRHGCYSCKHACISDMILSIRLLPPTLRQRH
jgi:hypothetical protein